MPDDILVVLRDADPAGELPARDVATTTAVLAAIPRDLAASPPARPARSIRARGLLVALAALAAAGSVAYAAGFRPWQRDQARWAGPGAPAGDANAVFQREYAAAQRALALPAGERFPRRSVAPNTIVGTGRGGEGESLAVLVAFSRWQCALVRAHDAGDRAGVIAAADRLDHIIDTNIVEAPTGTPEDGAAPAGLPGPVAVFGRGNEPVRVMFHRWVSDARSGDVRQLRDSCASNS